MLLEHPRSMAEVLTLMLEEWADPGGDVHDPLGPVVQIGLVG